MNLTNYHAKYLAHELTRRAAAGTVEGIVNVLADARVDLNPHQVADPGFLVCLAKTVTAPLIKAIAATKPHRVVILDAAFQGNDALKTNAVQAFKDQGVEMFRTA